MEILINVDESHNCMDNILATVARWANRDYELMFCNSWGFAYNPDQKKDLILGSYIKSCFENRNELLEKYHGIKLNFYKANNTSDLLKRIKTELRKKNLVSINTDVFLCPWFKQGYKIYHYLHYVFIEDYDEVNGILYCKDGTMGSNTGQLTISDLEIGSNTCLTFSFIETEKGNNDWHKIIKSAVDRLYSSNAFDAMRRFSIDFSGNFNIQNEVSGYEAFIGIAPLFREISTVGACRKKFAKTLQYLAKIHNLEQLQRLSEILNQIGDRWGSIFGMLLKSYHLPNNTSLINKIASKISKMADEEEEFANMLIQFLQTNSTIGSLGVDIISNFDIGQVNEYAYINLENYVNNQGFSSSLSSDCKAELSNGGKYYLTNGLPNNNNIVVNDMKFILSGINNNSNDNISCDGQIIDFNYANYSCIMILGCSELGSHSEYIEIQFKDGNSEKVPLELTNWFANKPKYKELVAWAGECAIRSKLDVTISPSTVHLYAKSYHIKTKGIIKEIRLPNCPNMHIFAITLAK